MSLPQSDCLGGEFNCVVELRLTNLTVIPYICTEYRHFAG